jgi:cytochrome c biogenesis protein CcmG, thiol:disulfide interchange protein DsbE
VTVKAGARAAAAALVVVLLALLVWDLARTDSGASFVTKIGQGKLPPAPEFSLPVLEDRRATWPPAVRSRVDDGRLALSELRGVPVVVNFWASWCIPCRVEAASFRTVAARYAGRVAFVGLNAQDLSGAARGFLRRYRPNYVSVRDGSDRTYTAYGLTGFPETYFVDRRGRTRLHVVGDVSRQQLDRYVRELIRTG